MGDLVATFAIDNSASATASTMQVTSPTRKQSVTTVLDITRANNIGEWQAMKIVKVRAKLTSLQLSCCRASSLTCPVSEGRCLV